MWSMTSSTSARRTSWVSMLRLTRGAKKAIPMTPPVSATALMISSGLFRPVAGHRAYAPTWVRARGFRGVPDGIPAGGVPAVGQIDQETQPVALLHHLSTEAAEPCVVQLATPAAHVVLGVVGQLQHPQAERVEDLEIVEVGLDGPGVLEVQDKAHLPLGLALLQLPDGAADADLVGVPIEELDVLVDAVHGLDKVVLLLGDGREPAADATVHERADLGLLLLEEARRGEAGIEDEGLVVQSPRPLFHLR